jgi:hypothetical protein
MSSSEKAVIRISDQVVWAANNAADGRSKDRTFSGVLVSMAAEAVKKKMDVVDLWENYVVVSPDLSKGGLAYLGTTGRKLFDYCNTLADNQIFRNSLFGEADRIRRATSKDKEARRAELQARQQDDATITDEFIDQQVTETLWIKVPDEKGREANPNLSRVNNIGKQILEHRDNVGGTIDINDEVCRKHDELVQDLALMTDGDGEIATEVTAVQFVTNVDYAIRDARSRMTNLTQMRNFITKPGQDGDYNSMDYEPLRTPKDIRKDLEDAERAALDNIEHLDDL